MVCHCILASYGRCGDCFRGKSWIPWNGKEVPLEYRSPLVPFDPSRCAEKVTDNYDKDGKLIGRTYEFGTKDELVELRKELIRLAGALEADDKLREAPWWAITIHKLRMLALGKIDS